MLESVFGPIYDEKFKPIGCVRRLGWRGSGSRVPIRDLTAPRLDDSQLACGTAAIAADKCFNNAGNGLWIHLSGKTTAMKLFEFLTIHGPRVQLRETSKSKTSKSLTANKSYHQPAFLQPWVGFDLNTLRSMYQDILCEERNFTDPSQTFPSLGYALDEAGIGDFIQESNRKVVEDALKETKELLGWHEFISMIRGHSAELIERTGNKRAFKPDWAGVRVGDDFAIKDLTNILPGDTKDSRSWKFNDLLGSKIPYAVLDFRKFGKYERPQWAKPLIQIFTYCVELKVRYGYLISDRELLVVRIRPYQKGETTAENRTEVAHPEKDPPRRSTRLQPNGIQSSELNQETIEKRDIRNGILEFASIKFGSQDGDVLTVNLALWWLHLLALKDNTVQRSYKALTNEALSKIERRLSDEAGTARAENGEDDDDAAVIHEREDLEAQIKEWQQRAEKLSPLNLKAIKPHLAELDHHLTLRSHIVGYGLTDADTAVWKTIRDNRVANAYVKKGLMVNLSRWFRYIEEAYREQATLAYRPATNGTSTTLDESDGPSHQQDSDDQTNAPLPTGAETTSSLLGKRPGRHSVDRGSKRQKV